MPASGIASAVGFPCAAGAFGYRADAGRSESRSRRVPVGQEKDRQAELYAAFEALGGQLTWDELTRLLGSDEYRPALVWQVMLLLGGDAAAAEEVVRASFAAFQDARSQLSDPSRRACGCTGRSRAGHGPSGRTSAPVTVTRHSLRLICPALGRRPPSASPGKPGTTRCSPFHTDSVRLSCCTPIWACPRSKPRRRWALVPGRPEATWPRPCPRSGTYPGRNDPPPESCYLPTPPHSSAVGDGSPLDR
jgi:hypothetical protein